LTSLASFFVQDASTGLDQGKSNQGLISGYESDIPAARMANNVVRPIRLASEYFWTEANGKDMNHGESS
jgi:hypothetical protein